MYFIIIRYTASMQISVNLLNSVYNKVIIRAVVLRYVTRYVSQHTLSIGYLKKRTMTGRVNPGFLDLFRANAAKIKQLLDLIHSPTDLHPPEVQTKANPVHGD